MDTQTSTLVNGNAATIAASVESSVEAAAPIQDAPQNATQAAAPVAAKVDNVEDIVKRICADGHSYVANVAVTNLETSVIRSKEGKDYLNAFITLANPIKAARKQSDGSFRIGWLGGFQTPFGSLLLVMRKHPFYGRYVSYIQEAAELEGGYATSYIAGTSIQILCQFVAAGVEEHNPFTRSQTAYSVESYDRYVYHIVGIGEPTDPITIGAFGELNRQIQADMLAAIKARRDARKAAASALAAAVATPSNDLPF